MPSNGGAPQSDASASSDAYGDFEVEMASSHKEKLFVSIIKDKCIAWGRGVADIQLSQKNIFSVEMISPNQVVTDLLGSKGASVNVNAYRVTLRTGQSGTLRLATADEHKVLKLIQ